MLIWSRVCSDSMVGYELTYENAGYYPKATIRKGTISPLKSGSRDVCRKHRSRRISFTCGKFGTSLHGFKKFLFPICDKKDKRYIDFESPTGVEFNSSLKPFGRVEFSQDRNRNFLTKQLPSSFALFLSLSLSLSLSYEQREARRQ